MLLGCNNYAALQCASQPEIYLVVQWVPINLTTVDDGCVLVTLAFLLLGQAFFLLTNLLKQYAYWLVIWVLRYKFSLYCLL